MALTKYAAVIVTYNREQLLKECIYNVRNQTLPPAHIVIVNNASTDGTDSYLEGLADEDQRCEIINLNSNIGGAGGFSIGIARCVEQDVDCVLIIDDDAMIAPDYMERLIDARESHREYSAFAGSVRVNGETDTFHRRNFSKYGLLSKNCPPTEYQKDCFECDIVSFCGMLLDRDLIKRIGLPHAEYFILFDDTEYSLRVLGYSRFLIIPGAVLNHKTVRQTERYPRRYDFRDYYAIRNRMLMVREHGGLADRLINFIDLFINVIFRNWLFAILRRDGYNWKYERELVKRALRDAKI